MENLQSREWLVLPQSHTFTQQIFFRPSHTRTPLFTMPTTLLVGSTPESLGSELIRRIGVIARDAVRERGVFNVAVSGGSMPKVGILSDYLRELMHPTRHCLREFAIPSGSTTLS